MMLAATRAGSADALFAELSSSQKEMFACSSAADADAAQGLPLDRGDARDRRFRRRRSDGARALRSAAHFYERIAEDFDKDKKDVAALTAFLGKTSS